MMTDCEAKLVYYGHPHTTTTRLIRTQRRGDRLFDIPLMVIELGLSYSSMAMGFFSCDVAFLLYQSLPVYLLVFTLIAYRMLGGNEVNLLELFHNFPSSS